MTTVKLLENHWEGCETPNPGRRNKPRKKRLVKLGRERFLMIGLGPKTKTIHRNPQTTEGTTTVKRHHRRKSHHKRFVLRQNPRHVRHVRHHRRYRRNPPLAAALNPSGMMETLKDGAIGAGGIGLVNFAGNQVATLAKIDPKFSGLVKIGLAGVVLPMVSKMVPGNFGGILKTMSKAATAAAILAAALPYLPVDIGKQLAGDETPSYVQLGPAAVYGEDEKALPAIMI